MFEKKKKKVSNGGEIIKDRTSNSAMGIHNENIQGMTQNEFQNQKQYMKTGFKGHSPSPTIQKNINGSVGNRMIKPTHQQKQGINHSKSQLQMT